MTDKRQLIFQNGRYDNCDNLKYKMTALRNKTQNLKKGKIWTEKRTVLTSVETVKYSKWQNWSTETLKI